MRANPNGDLPTKQMIFWSTSVCRHWCTSSSFALTVIWNDTQSETLGRDQAHKSGLVYFPGIRLPTPKLWTITEKFLMNNSITARSGNRTKDFTRSSPDSHHETNVAVLILVVVNVIL